MIVQLGVCTGSQDSWVLFIDLLCDLHASPHWTTFSSDSADNTHAVASGFVIHRLWRSWQRGL